MRELDVCLVCGMFSLIGGFFGGAVFTALARRMLTDTVKKAMNGGGTE